TPFPNVDTNAVILLIRNTKPAKTIHWVTVNQADSYELSNFVQSDFKRINYSTLEITERELSEALETGLSRPEQNNCDFKYRLCDFAKVMRGIATGANDFFFMTQQKADELNIPNEFLKSAIGRTRDVCGDKITTEDIRRLEEQHRPTLLFSINGNENIPESVYNYIKEGEKSGLPNRPLIKQRKPWYKMEQREVPPILFAYLGRRNLRFIRNQAGILPLTSFLCVYPICSDDTYIHNLWQALNHPETIKNLKLVGKSYGSGAIKVEPRSLDKIPIPDHIVEQYHLRQRCENKHKQSELFG
ncbi:MAG: SAM-dependent methyltransferase, partial [Desulfobacteraceae bacterium]|nr:SAM-dependent methyltransferase [Desulfobacteraceae bacterium]